MSLKEIQKHVDLWTSQFKPQYWQPLEIMTRLSEEVGELAREINHRWGPKQKKSTEDKKELEDEISDVIFTLCCLANSQGIDLEKSWNKKLKITSERDKNRFQKR